MENLFAGVGDNPPLAPPPPRRGRTESGEVGISEEVGVRIVPRLFCPNIYSGFHLSRPQ
ncbi:MULTISPECIES: hypothetical protein [Okeania]|uniref:hypothetical protein n=1 Tax=Okeania TaxID=1458928 RepID=UPI001374A960|nr:MULTISPECIES: hypothetical protein [Okeania]NET22277.1 hypothetical protein [Okeania sp. SIO1H5]NET78142.1 hypothetical protein [Okeania sp. SIO1F9]NET93745.1 hypothetical protein [Okeania sp. SIO1H2]